MSTWHPFVFFLFFRSDSILSPFLAVELAFTRLALKQEKFHKTTTPGGDVMFLGIDVSKNTLDVALLNESAKPRHKVFANNAAGHLEQQSALEPQSALEQQSEFAPEKWTVR